jgi:hypothetical protein
MTLNTPKMAPDEPIPIMNRPILAAAIVSLINKGTMPATVARIQRGIINLGFLRSSHIAKGMCINE